MINVSYGLRTVIFNKTSVSFNSDNTITVCPFEENEITITFNATQIPWFDPSPYTDEELIERVKKLLVFI